MCVCVYTNCCNSNQEKPSSAQAYIMFNHFTSYYTHVAHVH